MRDLKLRLRRRTSIIEELRNAYLRDVVALKHVVYDVCSAGESEAILKQHLEHLPTVDLRDPLILHGPKDGEFRVVPCENCGGKIDIVFNDSDLVKKLKERITHYKSQEQNLRLQVATTETTLEKNRREMEMMKISHGDEV